ncbi:MAG: hypothetical protein QW503_02320 [Sulfolobales archaeon]
MPVPAWLAVIGSWLLKHIWQVLLIAFAGTGLYFTWQAGNAIVAGIQVGAVGLGQMVASMGMLFTLIVPMVMMMMFTWMVSSLAGIFSD